MKKSKIGFFVLLTLAFLGLLLGQMALPGVAQADEISIFVNGNKLTADVAPYIQEGRVLVPFRALFEALGATVEWNAASQAVTGKKDGKEVRLTIGSKTAYVDGKAVALDVPAAITSGRTFVPLRFVAESLGARVNWDDVTQTVTVTSATASVPALPGSSPSAGKTISIKDSMGNTVLVPSPPKRIVCANSNVAQVICALGAADSIVGVSDTADFPPLLKSKEKVGSAFTPDADKIISLQPDVFFGYGGYTKQEIVDKIKRAGIPVVMLDCYKVNAMERDVLTLGQILGREQAAQEFVAYFNKYLNIVKSRTSNVPESKRPLVYIEGHTDYTTVGPGSGGLEMLEAAGGKNAASEYRMVSPKVTPEWVVAKNPQIIIKATSSNVPAGYGKPANAMADLRRDIMARPGWDKIEAVKSGKVYVISSQIYTSPSGIVGMAYFAKWFYPDLFKDIDPAAINRELLKKFYGLEAEGTWVYPQN